MFRRFLNWFKNLKLRGKMLFVLLAILMIFSLFSIFIFNMMLNELQNMVIESNLSTLSLINSEIQAELFRTEKATYYYISNEHIRAYVDKNARPEHKTALQAQLTRNFFKPLRTQLIPNMTSIMILIDANNYCYTHISSVTPPEEQKALALYISRNYQEGFVSNFINVPIKSDDKAERLYFALPISSEEKLQCCGYIVVGISTNFLLNILAKHFSENTALFVVDDHNQPICQFSRMPATEVRALRSIPEGRDWSIETASTRKIIVLRQRISVVPWTAIIQIPMDNITFQLQRYQILFWPMALGVLAISYFLVNHSLKLISRRLSEISHVFSEIKKGNMDTRFPVKYGDEISQIGDEFNQMIDHVQHLRVDVAEQKMRQREAELRALQSQINPHFLYNTLESIRMHAHLNRDQIVVEQIRLLSDLFRYTTSFDALKEEVTVREEVAHASAYLTLQQLRFPHRFSIGFQVSEDVLSEKILKIVLQPIVENAFIHGTRPGSSMGHIFISGFFDKAGNRNVISVLDNGPGIPEEKLLLLNQAILSKKETVFEDNENASIGLVNVNARLKLRYGDAYGIQIDSIVDKGTEVLIFFPSTIERDAL